MKTLLPKALLAIVLVTGLAACEEEGPMERAGEHLDETSTRIGNKIEDACEDAKGSMGAEDSDC